MRNARFLGRRAKQMIMVLSDVIAMPAALWTAFGTALSTKLQAIVNSI